MNQYNDLNRSIGQMRWYEGQRGLGTGEFEAAGNTLMIFGVIALVGIFIWGMKQ